MNTQITENPIAPSLPLALHPSVERISQTSPGLVEVTLRDWEDCHVMPAAIAGRPVIYKASTEILSKVIHLILDRKTQPVTVDFSGDFSATVTFEQEDGAFEVHDVSI